jgi:hypothetical protein
VADQVAERGVELDAAQAAGLLEVHLPDGLLAQGQQSIVGAEQRLRGQVQPEVVHTYVREAQVGVHAEPQRRALGAYVLHVVLGA